MLSLNPFFSVIISTKNRANLVCKAIRSILNQTFQDFEIIVIDNASTDETEHLIELIKDNRLHYYRNEIDKERCYARNRGINLAIGKYICFLDSDDEYLTNHLQVIYDFIADSEVKQALFFTNAYQTYNFQNLQERICPDMTKYELFDYILTYTFNPARVAVSSSILRDFDFDEKIPGLEDLDLWLRIATKYPIIQINERTILYQIHEESYSVSAPNRFERELKLYKYVFSKKELKSILPVKSMNRLISMCHYKLSMAMSTSFKPFKIHYHILTAFLLNARGYNINSNRTMAVIFIDQLPVLGFVIKKIRGFIKSIWN